MPPRHCACAIKAVAVRNFNLIAIFLLSVVPAHAQSQAWVQAVASGGYEARVITSDADCPKLESDKGEAAMTVRAPAGLRLVDLRGPIS